MKFKKLKEVDPRWKAYALGGCVCVLFFLCASNIREILGILGRFLDLFRPVFIGAIIAYIVYPLARLFDRRVFRTIKGKKQRWILSVILTLLVVLALLGVLLATLIPQLADSILTLLDNISAYIDNLTEFAQSVQPPWREAVDQLTEFISGAEGGIAKVGQLLTKNLNNIIKATSTIGSSAMNGVVGAIIAVYLLLAKESIGGTVKKLMKLLLKPLTYEQGRILVSKFNSIFSRYIICELLDAILVGVVNFLFMVFLKMPDALMISVAVGVTNLAPTFGPIVGAAIGGFILLLVKPTCVIPFLIFTFALQTADGYLVKPKLFGDALNVPGVVILIAIIAFGRMLGVVGMLIAIPAAAIIVYVYKEIFIPWLELRRDLREYKEQQNPEENS